MIDLTKYKIVDYLIVYARDNGAIKELEKNVKQKIEEGYIPLGGVACDTHFSLQSLVKVVPK